ncbi:MAG TPA: S8 family serine peptidase [Burkholderiales bacterium]|nr:S8 family serine peptidase [Burkholderiales bacterium]
MNSTAALELVRLTPLMERTSGRAEVLIGLVDGPVAMNHPGVASHNIREIPGSMSGACSRADSAACMHGTFVAGILAAKRGSPAPAICPDCTMLIRPIFSEATPGNGKMPSATSEELAKAVIEMIDAGARVLNLSAALVQPSSTSERRLEQALDHAASRHVIVVAAAGNQGTVGSSAITRHPWVLPVVACDLRGRPTAESNLSHSVGKRGLAAPGEDIISLAPEGKLQTFSGTSAATPFVTGAIALLWSEFPGATAADVKFAVTRARVPHRNTVVPPVLDVSGAYQIILSGR